jgi:hypothetical protein
MRGNLRGAGSGGFAQQNTAGVVTMHQASTTGEPSVDSSVEQRYRKAFNEFSSLVDFGYRFIESLVGQQPKSDRHSYAHTIFMKLVCHGLTLRDLSPSPSAPATRKLWDVSSNYAIARTLVETYESLAYVALEPVVPAETEFRLLLWKVHSEERRVEMLRLIGSNHPEIPQLKEELDEHRARLIDHPFFATVFGDFQKNVKASKTPPFHKSTRDRCGAVNVDYDYYRALQMQLSQHVHTFPLSVHQLFNFRTDDPECLRLMSMPLNYSSAFVSKALTGMRDLFAPDTPKFPSELENVIAVWEGILSHGVKAA